MMLADVPVQYAGYAPLDYDREYRGPVTVEEALVDSLNIPAVEVLDKVGYRNLYFFLERVGISTLNKAPKYYGLSLTLGSCEVKLLELTNAYAALARLGVYMPVKYLEDSTSGTTRRVLSKASSYLVTNILSDTERLKAIGIYRNNNIYPKVAWKTGTSYDHKDAWTISYNPEYTVGIWLGNFSGKSSKVLVGIETAASVAIRIFDWLYANRTAPWYEMPDTIGERYVCALSGEPASENCEHRVKDLYIKRFRTTQICSLHEKANGDTKTYVVLDKDKPMIVSPSHKCEYFITGMPRDEQKLVLTANGAADADNLYWFVDDKFYDKGYMGEKLFWDMVQGKHTITCADNYGRSSSVTIVVR
ncbi:MAG: penicillin-binding transpeptidase domain-containing protein, partial [Candidatus Omnitrophota bacterium]